jgi:hypothetical protein
MDWLGELYKGAHHNILPVADDHCKDKSSQNHPHQKRQGIVYKLKDYYFHVFEGQAIPDTGIAWLVCLIVRRRR